MAERLRSWALGRGFGLLGAGIVERSPTLTALRVPDGVDPAALRQGVRQQGIEIAVGLGPYGSTCVRVGHMGDIRMADLERTIDALEATLAAGDRDGMC
jgi:alanine-glyoxylate transaminase/serine-glyoxylate transaminase/serine-pyruvate transaminase